MVRSTMNNLTVGKVPRSGGRAAPSVIFASAMVVGLLFCVGLSALTGMHADVAKKPTSMNAANLVAQPGQTSGGGPLHVVQFALYDVGIYPREVRVSKGLIALSIEDLSGGTSGLVIERQDVNAPGPAGLVQRAANSLRGRGEIDLGPGSYVVYMADRPDNKALMIVEP